MAADSWVFILLWLKTSCWMVPVLLAMHDWFHQTFHNLDHWSCLKHPKWPLYRVVLFVLISWCSAAYVRVWQLLKLLPLFYKLTVTLNSSLVTCTSESFVLWWYSSCILIFWGREKLAIDWDSFVDWTHLLLKNNSDPVGLAFKPVLSSVSVSDLIVVRVNELLIQCVLRVPWP